MKRLLGGAGGVKLMRRRSGAGRNAIVGRLALAVIAGLIVHLLLFNAGKDESDERACYSIIGYEVPCGNLSIAAGSITTCLVAGLLLRGTAAPRSAHTDEPGDTVDIIT